LPDLGCMHLPALRSLHILCPRTSTHGNHVVEGMLNSVLENCQFQLRFLEIESDFATTAKFAEIISPLHKMKRLVVRTSSHQPMTNEEIFSRLTHDTKLPLLRIVQVNSRRWAIPAS
jgi:hypothetical protein